MFPPPTGLAWNVISKEEKARKIFQLDKLWEQISGRPRKKTVSVFHYVEILQKLWKALCDKNLMQRHNILQHNNELPHSVHLILVKIENIWLGSASLFSLQSGISPFRVTLV